MSNSLIMQTKLASGTSRKSRSENTNYINVLNSQMMEANMAPPLPGNDPALNGCSY